MKYSVAITTYNDSTEITDLLNNIMYFNLLPEEIVVADGGSNDTTIPIIEEYDSKIPIKIVKDGRLNISQGLNLAIKSCCCEVVMICATGNNYDNNYSSECMKKIDKGAEVCYGRLKGRRNNWVQRRYCDAFLNGIEGSVPEIATNHGVLIRKSVLENYGGFLTNFVRAGEDTEYYKYLREKGVIIETGDDVCVTWDVPASIKQFYSQVKWYTIASMQLNPLDNINRLLVSKAVRYCALLVFFCVVLALNPIIAVVSLLIFVLIIMCNFKLLRIILRDYVVVKYRKYMNKKYVVKR